MCVLNESRCCTRTGVQRVGKVQSKIFKLSALQKSKEAHPVTVEEEENLTEDAFSTWEGHSFEQNLRCEVYEAVDLQHPLSFDAPTATFAE